LDDLSEERSRITANKSEDNNVDGDEPGAEGASDNASIIGLWNGLPTLSCGEPEHTENVKRRYIGRAQIFSCQDIGTIFDWRSKFDLNSLLSNGSSENI